MIKKRCYKCKEEKPFTDEFFVKSKNNKSGLKTECKKCHNIRTKEWRKRNKEKIINKAKIRNRRNKYNITNKQYNNILEKQNNRCAICGIHKSKLDKNFAVDHDHKTGEIQGLLCNACNLMLGCSKDNILILIKASKFLLKNK